MTKMKTKEAPTVVMDDPADRKGELKRIGGSASDAFNNTLASSVVEALWLNLKCARRSW